MKKIFSLPGLLLPISIIPVYVIVQLAIGNSALDVHMLDTYFKGSTNEPLRVKYWLPMIISWVFHILLCQLQTFNRALAWVHVLLTVLVFAIVNDPLIYQAPRRYYDYEIGAVDKILRLNSSTLFCWAIMFMGTQTAFWLYGLRAVIKHSRNNSTEITT